MDSLALARAMPEGRYASAAVRRTPTISKAIVGRPMVHPRDKLPSLKELLRH
jgi:hypothetical protein